MKLLQVSAICCTVMMGQVVDSARDLRAAHLTS